MRVLTILILLQMIVLVLSAKKAAKVLKQSNKFENPGFIRDRKRRIIYKPAYPDYWGMNKIRPYSVNWMDYCAPYHCGDYHKPACGLNRKSMRFQWFQSGCHIVLNNACATYRGFLKFDQVDTKYCRAYVMYTLRSGCPETCPKIQNPVCAVNVDTNRAAVFRNVCFLYKRNCRGVLQEFVEVSMNVCLNDLALAVEALEEASNELPNQLEDQSATENPKQTVLVENTQDSDEDPGNRYYIA